jgi:hypothetical protein
MESFDQILDRMLQQAVRLDRKKFDQTQSRMLGYSEKEGVLMELVRDIQKLERLQLTDRELLKVVDRA